MTKPKRKQSSQTRSWENLTDRRKLRHIENTLDKVISESIQNDSIQSHQYFKDCVENYSQESGKAPITVELCVGSDDDDEIRGDRSSAINEALHQRRIPNLFLIKIYARITVIVR